MGEIPVSVGPDGSREAGAETRLIYHVARAGDWARALAESRYQGGWLCRADGFIHFSTRDQLEATLKRFFAGAEGLVLLAAEAEKLGPGLKWERRPDGALYPHYYGALAVSRLTSLGPIATDGAGGHVLPGPLPGPGASPVGGGSL